MEANGETYDLKTERTNIFYSAGRCAKGGEWNVPRNIVIGITVYPKTRVMISELPFDLAKFQKFTIESEQDSLFYKNVAEGVIVGTKQDGEVTVYQYFPTPKDNHLRCPNPPPHANPRKFDEYYEISLEDEHARLDNFAEYLQENRQLRGYIIVYGLTKPHSDQRKMRASRAKDYLLNVHHLPENRVVSLVGGLTKFFKVELYAVPTSATPPVPIPRDE